MPVADLLRLKRAIRPLALVDGSSVMRQARMVKSPAEVRRIRHICQIVSDAFEALPCRGRRNVSLVPGARA